ncbi:MAG: hypothetical protein HY898_10310 [Deltaproteobacteria bacterium]|nr:hypothetical protein [Deltaproteobacteria bacterium]
MPRVSWFSRALLTGLCVVVPARGDEAPEAAKIRIAAQEFDAGRRAYLQQDYESASVHFENADRDSPSIEALRLAIRARKEGGFAARAATHAEQALKRYPTDQATVTLAQSVLEELRPGLYKLQVKCEPACGLVVDDKSMFDQQSVEQVVYLQPGHHSVAATWTQGRGRAVGIEAEKGRGQLIVFKPTELEPPPATSAAAPAPTRPTEPPPPPPKASGLPPAVFIVGAGVTAVLTGVTIWSGLDTRNNPGRSTVELACADKGDSCPEYQDGLSRQKRTNILLGTTIGVGVVTGVVALFTRWGDGKVQGSSQQGGFRVEPTIGWREGIQAGAIGRF